MLILSLSLLLLFVRLSWATHQTVLKDHGVGPFREKFAQLVNETLDMWHVPGLTIAVVDGENVWAEVSVNLRGFPQDIIVYEMTDKISVVSHPVPVSFQYIYIPK